ncbi:unnamed protein product [Rotaria sordida]|uniref:Uncharacterized protein n=1 Tax=Rotaria sordida TaxID=392033 RepID=A0A814YMS6_9BILA|nr:unnamed protein product [Rotaria sordida]
MVRQFSHIPTSDTSLFAAHHEKFSFSLFAPLPSNPTNPKEIPSSNLLASHKCSSTTTMIRQFSHIPTSDTSLFAAHHENFSFSLFAPLSSNPTNPAEILSSNLLASSLISNPPLKRF